MKPTVILQTESVQVRIMPLAPGAATAWHHHSEVTDTMVAMQGEIRVELKQPEEVIDLSPGQHCTVAVGRVHRVVNPLGEESRYLLVQGVGRYDFIEHAGNSPHKGGKVAD